MYSTNQLDFWFDLAAMALPMLAVFAMFFLGSAAVMTAVFLINKAIVREKEPNVYRAVTIGLSLVFFAVYIQGNFLAGDLPALDGSTILWDEYKTNDFITICVCVLLVLVIVLMLLKLKLKQTFHAVAVSAVLVFAMLTVSLITELISWNAFVRKDSIITTIDGFDTISEDENFIVILNDAVGSSEFKKVIEANPEYKKVFEDFTYFPDTLGGYPCTRDTIPLVLGGKLNKNEMAFDDFSSQAYNDSPLFYELTERGYDITLYESELIWYGSKNFVISNSTAYESYKLTPWFYLQEEMKYVKYKYLPYGLKRHSDIESLDFNGVVDKYIWDDRTVHGMVTGTPVLEKIPEKSFKFIHTEGAHIPFKYDKDLNFLDEPGTYEQKIEATITMLNAYIERLKANDAYDNSVIILMADHGNTNLNSSTDMLVRGNPMFMVKGINEHHEFTMSDKPLSYLDLIDIYGKLLDEKTADEAVADIPDERERFFMWYRNFRLEYHMEEYVVTDKAWEWQKFKKTGNEYDL